MVDRFWQLMYIVAYRLAKCWWWLRRPMGRGSYVAVWVNDSVLIIRNSYKRSFCVPAGGVDRGETYLQAAVRELREESAIVADPDQLLFIQEYTKFSEHKHDVSQLFELRLQKQPDVIIDNREVVFAEFMTLDEALRLPLVPVVDEYLRTISEPASTEDPTPREAR